MTEDTLKPSTKTSSEKGCPRLLTEWDLADNFREWERERSEENETSTEEGDDDE